MEEKPKCPRCGNDDDIHVCIPKVIDMLKEDIGFKKLLIDLLKDIKDEGRA